MKQVWLPELAVHGMPAHLLDSGLGKRIETSSMWSMNYTTLLGPSDHPTNQTLAPAMTMHPGCPSLLVETRNTQQ